MRDDTERLYTLNLQLKALLDERHALLDRCQTAATEANTWPDMGRATQLFVSVQPPSAEPLKP